MALNLTLPADADLVETTFVLDDGPIVINYAGKRVKLTCVVIKEYTDGRDTDVELSGMPVTDKNVRDKRYAERVSAHSVENKVAVLIAWEQRNAKAGV